MLSTFSFKILKWDFFPAFFPLPFWGWLGVGGRQGVLGSLLHNTQRGTWEANKARLQKIALLLC